MSPEADPDPIATNPNPTIHPGSEGHREHLGSPGDSDEGTSALYASRCEDISNACTSVHGGKLDIGAQRVAS